jgi:hypothetical protein
MQMAVLAVDEPFKCFASKKEANTYAQYQCVSWMPRMVNSILNKRFLRQAFEFPAPGMMAGFKARSGGRLL